MVIGHFGFGLGAKKYAPKLSLGLIFLAVQFADLLWPDLVLLNIEKVRIQPEDAKFPLDFIYYPFSHSLLMSIFWAAVFGLIYWLIKKDRVSATVLGICVLSHWFLDLIVHKPDLPLYPGSSVLLGFGLWNWPWLTALAEGIIFFTGMIFYLQTTRARNSSRQMGILVDDYFVDCRAYCGSPFSASRNSNSDWLGNTGTMGLCVTWFLGGS